MGFGPWSGNLPSYRALVNRMRIGFKGEGKDGPGSTPEQPAIASDDARKAALQAMKLSVRRACFAFQYVATVKGRKPENLQDQEAYNWLKENSIDEGKGDLGELTDYRLPPSVESFTRYCSEARNALDENKYTPRGGRKHGRSIVSGQEIERQKGDDE